MKVAAIWRHPVKSMAGEPLDSVSIDAHGLSGDRVVQVHDRGGRIATARRVPGLLPLARRWDSTASRGSTVIPGTLDPDAAEQDPGVLRDLVRRFGGRLCVDAQVARGGWVRVGKAVLIDV